MNDIFIKDGDDWYYVDDENVKQGPYASKIEAACALFDSYDLTMTYDGDINE